MLASQRVQLSRGTYLVLEEIGYGASSNVYLVQFLQRNLIQLPTQATNSVPPENSPPQPAEEPNPDMTRLDQLLIRSRQGDLGDQSSVNACISSNLMENGRQDTLVPYRKAGEVDNGAELFALKTVLIEADNAEQRRKQKEYWRQVEILGKLRHPGIVRIVDHGVTVREGVRELHLVTEWGRGGNFLRFLDAVSHAAFLATDAQTIYKYCIAQIVETVDYLQSMGVSHRDLKAENFILDEHYCLKLIDFGLAEQALSVEGDEGRGYVGTKQYISPEMIDRGRHPYPRQHYSKSDVWSVGVLIYYIFTRRYPFTGINTFCILESIKTRDPDLSHFQTPHLRQLLTSMLRKNPADRAGIREVKLSPYFSDVDFGSVFGRESPFPRLIREQGEETLFSEELVVRINGQTKRRIISLTRKPTPQRPPRQEPLLDHLSSLANIDIKKNLSENTEGFNSENRIQSSVSLDLPPLIKHYLTIGKVGSTAHPKYLEILPSTTLSPATRQKCRLDWVAKGSTLYEDEPQSVELKFESQETLEAFVGSFQRARETVTT